MEGFSLNCVQLQEYQPNRYPFLTIHHADEVILGESANGYKNLTLNERRSKEGETVVPLVEKVDLEDLVGSEIVEKTLRMDDSFAANDTMLRGIPLTFLQSEPAGIMAFTRARIHRAGTSRCYRWHVRELGYFSISAPAPAFNYTLVRG